MIKILLLEDDAVLSAELTKFLEQKQCDVRRVFDGQAFLRELRAGPQDLYLLDINVPGINGLEVCEHIRAKDAHTPIIMISAYGELSDKKEAFSRLADDYLVKPFQFEELLLRIHSLLRRKENITTTADEIVAVGDLSINKNTHAVLRGGQEVHLTVKEFQLLLLLAENPGRVFSKQQIAETVWQHNFNTNTNTVEVYINFLRKKIDRDFEEKLLHTRSGFGYFLKAQT